MILYNNVLIDTIFFHKNSAALNIFHLYLFVCTFIGFFSFKYFSLSSSNITWDFLQMCFCLSVRVITLNKLVSISCTLMVINIQIIIDIFDAFYLKENMFLIDFILLSVSHNTGKLLHRLSNNCNRCACHWINCFGYTVELQFSICHIFIFIVFQRWKFEASIEFTRLIFKLYQGNPLHI